MYVYACMYVLQVNELIEEWMVLANAAVAAQIVGAFPEAALLRRHAPPSEESLQWLQQALEQRGLTLEADTAAGLGKSLDKLSGDAAAPAAPQHRGTAAPTPPPRSPATL